MTERETLIEALARHRELLVFTARGLTQEQALTTSTVSALTIASLLKHVADTEEQWMAFAVRGAVAFSGSEVYDGDVDWDAVSDTAAQNDGDWSGSEWVDDRFAVTELETLEVLRARVAQVAARSEEILREVDLDAEHRLPEAPWFQPGASWSARRVALHMLAEISQHAGHADIIRESIDGQRSMG